MTADSAISDILDTYDRRLDEKSQEAREREGRRAEFRDRSERLIRTVIEPTLTEVGEDVRARGHVWSVEERIDIQGQPAIACMFRARGTPPDGPGSELTFRCLFPDRVATTAVVLQGDTLREFPARSHSTENIDVEIVQAEIARFLARALDHT